MVAPNNIFFSFQRTSVIVGLLLRHFHSFSLVFFISKQNILTKAIKNGALYALLELFFCMGSSLGKNFNSRHVNEEGLVQGQQVQPL